MQSEANFVNNCGKRENYEEIRDVIRLGGDINLALNQFIITVASHVTRNPIVHITRDTRTKTGKVKPNQIRHKKEDKTTTIFAAKDDNDASFIGKENYLNIAYL